MNSKEKFLEVSLDLFSKLGYVGVSVRDISKVLGMRESAMYKHYASKAQILEAIIQRAREKLKLFSEGLVLSGESTKNAVTIFFIKVFDFYTKDEFMNKFRKLMIISQYESFESKARYQDMFVEKSLRYYEDYFAEIIANKKVVDCSAKLMAYELYSVLFILMQQYDSEASEEKIEIAKKIITQHIGLFFSKYAFLEGNK